MLYSSRKARHSANSSAVLPDPTGLQSATSPRNAQLHPDSPADTNSERALVPVPSRVIRHIALRVLAYGSTLSSIAYTALRRAHRQLTRRQILQTTTHQRSPCARACVHAHQPSRSRRASAPRPRGHARGRARASVLPARRPARLLGPSTNDPGTCRLVGRPWCMLPLACIKVPSITTNRQPEVDQS